MGVQEVHLLEINNSTIIPFKITPQFNPEITLITLWWLIVILINYLFIKSCSDWKWLSYQLKNINKYNVIELIEKSIQITLIIKISYTSNTYHLGILKIKTATAKN